MCPVRGHFSTVTNLRGLIDDPYADHQDAAIATRAKLLTHLTSRSGCCSTAATSSTSCAGPAPMTPNSSRAATATTSPRTPTAWRKWLPRNQGQDSHARSAAEAGVTACAVDGAETLALATVDPGEPTITIPVTSTSPPSGAIATGMPS